MRFKEEGIWHRSVRMRSVGLWLGIPTGQCLRPGAVYKQLEMWIMTPNPYGALVSSLHSDALGARRGGLCCSHSGRRRRRALRRAAGGGTPLEASEIRL